MSIRAGHWPSDGSGTPGAPVAFGAFAEPTQPDEGIDQDRQHAGGHQGGGVLWLHPVLADAQRRDDHDDRQARGGQDGQLRASTFVRTPRKKAHVGRPRVKQEDER